MIVILLGPPGVGKGTQAELLANKHHLYPLSTGDLLRKAVQNQDNLAVKIKKILDMGALVPDDIVCNLIQDVLISFPKNHKGFILDGFPRTIKQAAILEEICNINTLPSPYIVSLKLSKLEIIRRLSSRVFCSKCYQSYNLVTNKMKIEEVCDQCGSQKFFRRQDDRKEVISTRLKEYDRQTKPLINFYKNHPGYISINAHQDIYGIANLINNFLFSQIDTNK